MVFLVPLVARDQTDPLVWPETMGNQVHWDRGETLAYQETLATMEIRYVFILSL